jgi:hypothetical protein
MLPRVLFVNTTSIDESLIIWNLLLCIRNSSLFDEFLCKLGLFWHAWTILKRERNERLKGPRVSKKAQFTHERVEYNVFLFDEPLKGSKSLKTFKISLTFRFDKL